jgi:hypothetical protein
MNVVLRATASDRSIDWHSRNEYEDIIETDTTQENNKYISSQQVHRSKPESAVKRAVANTFQAAFLDSADFNGAYDCTLHDNMNSDILFTHGKLRSKDSYKDTSHRSEEIELENLEFEKSGKIPSSSRRNFPWQRKFSTKYLAVKQKQGPYLSVGNRFAEYGLEETVADAGETESNLDEIIHDGHNSYVYEEKPQDSEHEEVLEDNRDIYNDETHKDGILNNFPPEIQETFKSDGSITGLQAIYQRKETTHRVLNQVTYPSKTEDGTRNYKHGSSSRSSENVSENNEKTQNIIRLRINNLKAKIKQELASKFDQIQNARAPTYDNIADSYMK